MTKRDYKYWLAKGVPAILTPGIIFALIYGPKNLDKIKSYDNDENIFPRSGYIEEIEDGDTVRLQSGQTVRLIGIDAPNSLLTKVSGGSLQVFDLTQDHCQRIIALMNQYRDLPMDLADASLIILAEHLGHGRILSVDQRDFNTYRWKNTYPFQNLLI